MNSAAFSELVAHEPLVFEPLAIELTAYVIVSAEPVQFLSNELEQLLHIQDQNS